MAKEEIKTKAEIKTVEEWRDMKMPKPLDKRYWYKDESWKFESAKQKFQWAVGEPMTEEQFDKAIKETLEHYHK